MFRINDSHNLNSAEMIDNITYDSVQTFQQQHDHFIDFSQPFPLHPTPHPHPQSQSHSPKISKTSLA
jgi:hypothetical protein